MRNLRGTLRNLAIVTSLLLSPAALRAQGGAAANSNARSGAAAVQVPDLSGNWSIPPGGPSWDPSDPAGTKPEQLAMTPWAQEQLKAAKPPFGARGTFEPNDPVQKYCDPPGTTRLFDYPWQFTLVQTPGQVYMLFEYAHLWRLVTMGQPHPKDLDATWLGDSVGRYDGDTLVIDTVGFNDKSWLDNVGHPHSDALHTVERFRRSGQDTLQLALTIEDPKAYTKPFTAQRAFKLSSFAMGETMCSLSEDESFQKSIMDRAAQPAAAK